MRHRIASYVLVLVSAAPVLACGSTEADTSSTALRALSSNELDPCPTPDAGQAVDTGTTDPGSPTTIDFSFVVDDSTTVIHASSPLDAFEQITIGNYPTTASAPVVYGSLPVGFEDAFSPGFCAGIRTKAVGAKGTSALAKLNKQQVRSAGGVAVNIVVSPFVGNKFAVQAGAAATSAGVLGSAFVIDNPLEISDVQFHIVFDPDAISNIIGETDALVAAQATYLSQQIGIVRSTGEFSSAFAAKDLFCDLSTGKAKIQMTVTGTVNGAPYTGQTTGTLLQSL